MKSALRITREQNFADWYQEMIKEADLAEHSGVRGCMVIKPWGCDRKAGDDRCGVREGVFARSVLTVFLQRIE
jgi:hypothetical protein